MVYIKNIYWCFLCSIISYTTKGLESTKIYVLDLPNDGANIALLKKYDEYDPIKEFAYDDQNRRQRVLKTVHPQKITHDKAAVLKTNTRSYDYEYVKPTKKRKRQPAQYDQIVRQTDYKSLIDLTRFAQDYLDIKDLGRSGGFASDYVDVDDFKSARALPNCNELYLNGFYDYTKVDCVPSRKTAIDRDNENFFRRLRAKNRKSDSHSSESVEEIKSKRKRPKPKRYKVIAKENSDSNSDSDDTNENDDDEESVPKNEDNRSEEESSIANDKNKSGVSENDETESDSAKEASVEVTTKKYKTKSKKTGKFEDRYVYLQGNKVYNADDFRRGMRQADFLPKRFHWDHDDYHKLGYYWFNGPKGNYKN